MVKKWAEIKVELQWIALSALGKWNEMRQTLHLFSVQPQVSWIELDDHYTHKLCCFGNAVDIFGGLFFMDFVRFLNYCGYE